MLHVYILNSFFIFSRVANDAISKMIGYKKKKNVYINEFSNRIEGLVTPKRFSRCSSSRKEATNL
jgi:hypothetical protein